MRATKTRDAWEFNALQTEKLIAIFQESIEQLTDMNELQNMIKLENVHKYCLSELENNYIKDFFKL